MSRYLLRERAEADLAEIWRFSAQRWNVAQADKYYGEIVGALRKLAAEPTPGRPCDEIRAGYRRHSVGSYVIFYLSGDEIVDVVRILHARRDFHRHLPSA